MDPDACWCDVFYHDGVAQLKEVLQVCTCVLARQTTKLVCLHHCDRQVWSLMEGAAVAARTGQQARVPLSLVPYS